LIPAWVLLNEVGMQTTRLASTHLVAVLLWVASGAASAEAASKCADHYAVVEPSGNLGEFLDLFDWQFGTSDAEVVLVNGQKIPMDRSRIAGAYACQFNGKFPPESACASGTTLTRGTDVRYICHAKEDIAEESKTCLDGYRKIQNFEYETAPAGKIGRFGFVCDAESDAGQDGFNEDVCGDSGASPLLNFVHYAPGNPFPMLGCVYLR